MEIEIRNNAMTITGYVAAVERDSRVLQPHQSPRASMPFVERVRSGTFKKALERAPTVELRFNHRRAIGGTGQNLELEEDVIGLKAKAVITDLEVIEAARNGELRGWSYGFRNPKDEWEPSETEGVERRTLDEIQLTEVSLLTVTPAYIATTVELRGDEESVLEERGREDKPTVLEHEPVDYSLLDREIEIYALQGGTHG